MIPSPRQPADDVLDRTRTAELADLARRGDAEAFGELYRLHSAEVFRFAYYRLSSRETAEDIVAEAWIRAYRRVDTFTWVAGGFVAWVITIARNLILDLYKSSRNRYEITTGDMLDPGNEPSTESIVLSAMTTVEIHSAVADLRPKQRDVITARFLDGLSITETAEHLDTTEGAVKTLQFRAVRTLAKDPRLAPEISA